MTTDKRRRFYAACFSPGQHEDESTAGRVMQVATRWLEKNGIRYVHKYGMCYESWFVYIELPDDWPDVPEVIGCWNDVANLFPPVQRRPYEVYLSVGRCCTEAELASCGLKQQGE